MLRRKAIKNLHEEVDRATRMGCTAEYIETLMYAEKSLKLLEDIDNLVNDQSVDRLIMAARVRGMLCEL